ncbi:MAG TPA: hypothetical protein PLX07_15625 [Microthrixaceae bacterium]|nr:hypothetical protein [Microthrixaceae bacterium]
MLPALRARIAKHRRKGLLLNGSTPAYATSSFTNGTWAVTANGSTQATLTLTVRDAAAVAVGGLPVVFTVERVSVGAATSLVVAAPTTVGSGETSDLTVYALDTTSRPLPGIPAASVVLAATGSTNTLGQPSAVTDRNGAATGTLSSTTTEAKTVSATIAGQAITDTATVTVSGSAPATVFESTWSTGTGHTDAVLRSTGEATPWAGVTDTTGNCLEVVSAASVSANTGTLTGYAGNVLRVEFGNSSGDGQLITSNLFAASTDHYYRDYIRSDSGKRSNHGAGTFAAGDFANFQILAHVHRGGASESDALHLGWEINLNVGGGGRDYQSPALSKATWYRREVWIEFNPLDGTQYRPHFRIYNLAGTLLYENDDFTRVDGSGGPATLTNDLATVGGWVSLGTVDNPADVNGTRCWVLGSEDPSDATGYNPATPNYVYHAKVAVSTAGWVGA